MSGGVMSSQDFDALRVDAGGSKGSLSLGPSVTSIRDLTDVDIHDPVLDGQILKFIASTGKWTNVSPELLTNDFVEGYYTLSGTSYSDTFVIPHGFGATPTHVIVDPQSPEADDDFTISLDSINITLVYTFPPPFGTNNLMFYYRVS